MTGELCKACERALSRCCGGFFISIGGFARGMTLGVRAVVLDDQNLRVSGQAQLCRRWRLPGGGVETGETFRDALQRELEEEGRIELDGRAGLARPVLQQPCVSPRPCRGLSGQAVQAGSTTGGRTARSSPADFSKLARCRPAPPRGRACGYLKCSRAGCPSRHGVRRSRVRRKWWKDALLERAAKARSWYGGLSWQD